MDKDSIGLSLPQSVTVRGYEIKRAPLGAYLQALKQLQSFPKEVTAALFPGQNADQVLVALKHLNSDALLALVARALTVVPDRALALVAKLAGIPLNRLTNDANIGLDGLMEIVTAWMELNGIENFTRAARQLMEKLRAPAASTGSRD